jgi:hypothetical protein
MKDPFWAFCPAGIISSTVPEWIQTLLSIDFPGRRKMSPGRVFRHRARGGRFCRCPANSAGQGGKFRRVGRWRLPLFRRKPERTPDAFMMNAAARLDAAKAARSR